MKVIALFLVLLWSGVAHAQKEPIGFKDFPLGGRMNEFKARFPDFSCEAGRCTACMPNVMDSSRLAEERIRLMMACRERNTYGGVPAGTVSAWFKDEKLVRVAVTFMNVRYDKLAAALTSRFGEPNTRVHEIVQNRMGAKFDNEILTWAAAGTLLRISKYSIDIERGSVLIATAEEIAESERKRKEAAEKGAKDL